MGSKRTASLAWKSGLKLPKNLMESSILAKFHFLLFYTRLFQSSLIGHVYYCCASVKSDSWKMMSLRWFFQKLHQRENSQFRKKQLTFNTSWFCLLKSTSFQHVACCKHHHFRCGEEERHLWRPSGRQHELQRVRGVLRMTKWTVMKNHR